MKKVHFFMKSLFWATIGLTFAACSNNDFEEFETPVVAESVSTQTIKMDFVGCVQSFDQQGQQNVTRATTSSWNEGDKLYLIFNNTTAKVYGEATYSATSGWTVNYSGVLSTGTGITCEVRYFANTTMQSSYQITMNSNTEIYEALDGTYDYADGELIVQATLVPKTGRIRFSGTKGDKIHVSGFSIYTTYTQEQNTFASADQIVTLTVADDGYTPYIYGTVTSTDQIISVVGKDFAYNRVLPTEKMASGKSGYMAIPSEASHANWQTGMYVKVKNNTIKMMPVTGHTSGFFLIGETEVTVGLYNTVTGSSSVSANPDKRQYGEVFSFISKLNILTNLNFDLPTKEQWIYAAKGGKYSLGYTFAGSNNPDEVAWYKVTTGAGINAYASTHDVKTMAPNELGLYDMSGNAEEWVKKYARLSNGYYNSVYSRLGGKWDSTVDDIHVDSENYVTDGSFGSEQEALNNTALDFYYTGGYRLVLTF